MAADRTVPAGTVDIDGEDYMDAVKEEIDWLGVAAPTPLGSVAGSDSITAAADPPISGYGDGLAFWFVPDETNTADDPTIDVDSVGAKDIVDEEGVGLAAGDLIAGRCYLIVYRTTGDAFRVMAGVRSSGSAPNVLPPGHVSGLILSNNATDATNDIDVSIGQARDNTDSDDMVLPSGLTKRLDANFSEGTNQGGLDTGSKANSTLYSVWAIKRLDTGVVDILFSASMTSPTMPTNYTLKQLMGYLWTDGSGTIRPFWQNPYDPDEVRFKTSILDRTEADSGTTSAFLVTLTVPPRTLALITAWVNEASANYLLITPTTVTDEAPGASNFNVAGSGSAAAGVNPSPLEVFADDSRQVRARTGGASGAFVSFGIRTRGWRFKRGGEVTTAVARAAFSGGDMLSSVYDPTGVEDDAFDMANMVEAADAKVMTAAERTKLAAAATAEDGILNAIAFA